MARWGRRGIARWLGALLPGRRGVVRIRRRRGWGLPSAGGHFVSRSRPAAGGRFVPASRPRTTSRPASGGRFVAGSRRSLFARPGRSERQRHSTVKRVRVSSRPPGQPRRRLGGKRMVLIALLSFFVFLSLTFVYVERNLRPPLMHVATMRVKQIVTRAINEAIANQVASRADAERLVDWQKSEDGRVSGFMLNYAEHMRITSETVETVQRTLHEIKHVPEHIPIGQAIGSAVIASFGPRMPVRFEPVGAAKVELGTRQRDAGINMILVEVYIRITAEMAIIIPFDTQPETVVTEIPISYLLVVGDVPMYYYDNKGNPSGSTADHAPNIALPLPEPDKAASGEAHVETETKTDSETGNETALPEKL